MEYSHDYNPASYQAQVDKGYKWNGAGWDYMGGNAASDAYGADMARRYGLPTDSAASGGYAPSVGGGRSGGGTTSLATGGSVASGGSTGPYSADAQLAQTRSEFDRILKSGLDQMGEQQNIRGAFGGGVPAHEAGQFIARNKEGQMAAIERIMNDMLGRNQSWDMEQKRFELQKQLAMMGAGGGNSRSYGGANENAENMDLYNRLYGGGSAPGYDTGGGNGHTTGPLGSYTGYGPGGGGLGDLSGLGLGVGGMYDYPVNVASDGGNLGTGSLDWLSGIMQGI